MMGFDNQPHATPAAGASGPVIFEATAEDFEDKVLRASMEKPILAYFTAPWCGPCKQLGPIMDKAVQAAGGKVAMAKIDLDSNQELAAALRIQSVPTIFAFFGGRPVDAFQGVVPESQIQDFIKKLIQAASAAQPDAIDIPEALSMAAQALAAGDLGGAQTAYAQILSQDESNVQAYVGMIRVYIAAGHIDQARQMAEGAPEDIAKHASFSEAKTALELAEAAPQGDFAELEAKVQKNPKDHQARYDLAVALFAAGQKEAAIDHLLQIIEADRGWNDEEARKQLLKFFEAMGHADPLTVESRRKLSTILFS